MTKQSNSKSAEQQGDHSSEPPDLNLNNDLASAENTCQNKSTHSLRKASLSKREIMEELSRQRFPWDD